MGKIIKFNLPVTESVKEYLADVSLPDGCEIGEPIWRTKAWGTHRNLPETYNFLKSGIKPKKGLSQEDYLPEPWFSTCQTLVIWLRRNQNLEGGRITGILSAVKGFIKFICIDTKQCSSPSHLKTKHFAKFEEFLRQRVDKKNLTVGGARLTALGIEKFALFLNHFNFNEDKIVYKQKFQRPTSSHEYKIVRENSNGNTLENEIIHKTKLLEIDILFALGNLFGECEDRIDKFFLATTLFLSVTGFRVSELLSLKDDCYAEYEEKGETLAEIRYNAEKGGLSVAKPIPPSALPFVKECLNIILDFTRPGRLLAKRIDKEKSVIPLSDKIWERTEINIKEVAALLGLSSDSVKRIVNLSGLSPTVDSTDCYLTLEFNGCFKFILSNSEICQIK